MIALSTSRSGVDSGFVDAGVHLPLSAIWNNWSVLIEVKLECYVGVSARAVG